MTKSCRDKHGRWTNPWPTWQFPSYATLLRFLLLDKNHSNIPSSKEVVEGFRTEFSRLLCCQTSKSALIINVKKKKKGEKKSSGYVLKLCEMEALLCDSRYLVVEFQQKVSHLSYYSTQLVIPPYINSLWELGEAFLLKHFLEKLSLDLPDEV